MNANQLVFEVAPESFQDDVVGRSRDAAVLLLFWADQMPESVRARHQLEAMVASYGGKVLLALVDVARDPTLAQHLRVQALPSLRVVKDGQIVEQMDGPQDETRLRQVLDQLTMSSGDLVRQQLDELKAQGRNDEAQALLTEAISAEPNNPVFKVELADLLITQGEVDDARTVLAGVPEDADGRDRPQARLEFAEEAAGMPDADTLNVKVADDGSDLEARYQLAVVCAAAGEFEAALEQAMFILQTDRDFREDIGRLTMIRIFDALGKGSELAGRYRRRMFNFMH